MALCPSMQEIITVYDKKNILHNPPLELAEGEFIPYFEKPERAQYVLDQVQGRKLGPVVAPEALLTPENLRGIHSPRYVDFLHQAWERWIAAGRQGPIYPAAFALQNRQAREPKVIHGQLGLYMADGCVALTETSWQAIEASANTALSAQKIMANGAQAAFALCRPPGHHAGANFAAGYCFINNAAVAAQAFIVQGAKRVAILDVDYHHGNGTQEIFYDRKDVLFVSLHADPAYDYPFYLGYADEKGAGKGEGFNINYPLALGTDYAGWKLALTDALAKIRNYGPDVLIISLGVDTYKKDPISKFTLDSPDYLDMGANIAKAGLPTLFVMEGGYAIDEVGINATNVIAGYMQS